MVAAGNYLFPNLGNVKLEVQASQHSDLRKTALECVLR
jgi:hypothetical protein